jgi:hypothetical protein
MTLIGAILVSCKASVEDCFKSTGALVLEERSLMEFDSIRLEDNVNVILIQDTLNKVIVEAGENLLPKIKTDVSNRLLVLKNENDCNWVRKLNIPVNAYVHFKDISILTNLGVANITNQDTLKIQGHAIDIRIVESGDIHLVGEFDWIYARIIVALGNLTLEGKAGGLELYADGTSIVHAENMQVNFASIETLLTGDIWVNATDQIGAKIFWQGNVYYKNSPQIVFQKETSTGKLIKIP